ncbi:MAG: WD40/YVTN/BNR-like repeat-containing protein [Roseiflexaceae bacterium]
MAETNDFRGLLEWRCIGPFRGGRVVAVAGDYQNPNVFYFGGCAGGVWKTSDAGAYWECVSDGFFNTAAVGALAVAPSDSNVIYAGTGETTIRIDVSHGDGVYKSTDAGVTWAHVGLADTRQIGKIRVDPHDPDIVYVAALGHAFGPNQERGVYKSTDGGKSWRQVLFKSEKAGAVDLSIDMTNPRVLYAAVWEGTRSFWQISSGGPESGLWRSTDGGETWADLSDKPGMPKGIKGKIGVAASPAQPGRVWALIEHKTAGGLYRSDDGGEKWEQVSDNQHLVSRAWYYIHITADPQNPDTVYINNLSFYKSTDGGKTFAEIATPHGDNHDLWIDPRNPQRMIQGNDGGANVSLNGALTWSSIYNQPTAQFYHIAADNRDPYYVYGTQQDNSSVAVPSRSHHSCITWGDCYIAGTGESGYIAVRPDDHNIVYVGAIGSSPGGGNSIQRYDHRTRQIRLITTWPEVTSGYGASEDKYRFAWTYPIVISPHDPNVLYIGGNLVFKTTNEGQSWTPISPDLTRADPKTLQPTGGPVNRDSIGAETYATVFAFAESPHEKGVLWAGSDDGLLHISKDGGGSWARITPPDLPEWTMISCIEISPYDKASAYVAATCYKLDDYHPYLYKTSDYGQTWQRIDTGIAADAFTRVIRADPARKGLLYAGTETGLYLSFDDGASWQHFQLNLPVAPIHDLLIKGSDLIAGTHGRSIWVLDDITLLHQMHDTIRAADTHLFTPRTTARVGGGIDWSSDLPGKNYVGTTTGAYLVTKTPENATIRKYLDAGQNPPHGAIVTYYLKQQPADVITLSFKDAQGNEVRAFKSKPAERPEPGTAVQEATAAAVAGLEGSGEAGVAGSVAGGATPTAKDDPSAKELKISASAGWNRFVWDLRHTPAAKVEGKDPPAEMTVEGPLVVPGIYQVTLNVGEQSLTESFEVICDPAAPAAQEDLQAQFDLLMQIHQKIDSTIVAINRMRDLRGQLDGWSKRVEGLPNGKPIAEAAAALKEKVLAVEKTFLLPDLRPGWADNLNQGVRLLEQLVALPSAVNLGNYRPTDQAHEVFQHFSAKIDAQLARFGQLIETDLAALNAQIAAAQIGALVVKA